MQTYEERKEYLSKWNKANKDKRYQYTKNYWYKKLLQELEEGTAKLSAKVDSDSKRLKIDCRDFIGDTQSRSYRLYENVREALNDFTEEYREYKAQDIVNKAILEFIEKYKK